MAIADIVTLGFGNGVYDPGVNKLPTLGYSIAAPPVHNPVVSAGATSDCGLLAASSDCGSLGATIPDNNDDTNVSPYSATVTGG